MVIRRFLNQVASFAGHGTLILLGFNARYLDEGRLKEELPAQGLELEAIVSQWWNPSVVYALRRRGGGLRVAPPRAARSQ